MFRKKDFRRRGKKELETKVRNQKLELIYTNVIYLVLVSLFIYIILLQSSQYTKIAGVARSSITELNLCHRLVSNISQECITTENEYVKYIHQLSNDLELSDTNYKTFVNRYIECNSERNGLKDYFKSMPFVKPAEEFASSHEYNIRDFNCVDFNHGCADIFRKMGYESWNVRVKLDCKKFNCTTGYHLITYIAMPVDCTGQFHIISPDEFDAYGISKEGQ
jgi:hypothetical protein